MRHYLCTFTLESTAKRFGTMLGSFVPQMGGIEVTPSEEGGYEVWLLDSADMLECILDANLLYRVARML